MWRASLAVPVETERGYLRMNVYSLRLRFYDVWLLKRLGDMGAEPYQSARLPQIRFRADSEELAKLKAQSLIDDMDCNGYHVRGGSLLIKKPVHWNPDGDWCFIWNYSSVKAESVGTLGSLEKWSDAPRFDFATPDPELESVI
jgi:hypothetical protein